MLNLRSTMDSMMKVYFPTWIVSSDLNFVDQWRMMFRNPETPFVQIFTTRLKNAKITENDFLNAIGLFRQKMNIEVREGCFPQVENEKEWDEIFQRLMMKDYMLKASLQIVGTGISKEENGM